MADLDSRGRHPGRDRLKRGPVLARLHGPGLETPTSSLLKKGFCPGEDASLIRGTSLRRQIDSRRRAVGFFLFKPLENDGVFQQTASGPLRVECGVMAAARTERPQAWQR